MSHWTKANTLEFDDGKTAQDKLGAIDGISSSRESNSDKIAASTALVSELNSDLESFQTSFQDGCNALVSKCTELGVAPVTNSPYDIANAIQSIYETAAALGLKVNSFSIPRTGGSHITLTYNAGHVVKYAGLKGFSTQSAGSATGGGPTCSLSVSWSGTKITVVTWGTSGGTEVQGYYFY